MPRPLRLSAPVVLLLSSLVLASLASANPCLPGCGRATAEPRGSSSTAEGESALWEPAWEHCLHTRYPSSIQCETATGPVYVGVVTGPSAGCARGILSVNGQVVADSLWVC